ncbi:MAG: prolipoprotein diacylglyceryl transferase [candidate division Zixibacteria bacterium]
MLPELFNIGPLPIRAYGLMLAVSFLLGVFYVRKQTQKDNRDFDNYLSIAYIMIFGGIFGARFGYVILHLSEFTSNPIAVINPFAAGSFGIAGLNLYGGLLLAIAGSVAFCRIKKMSILETFDYFAPTVGIGLVFTRVGCFCNGCCFGTPTDLPWGVVFPAGSIPFYQFGGQALHPAQLYSSLYGLLLFGLLHLMMKRKQFHGQLLAVLFMVEAFFRFVIEYVRFYEDAMVFTLGPLVPTYNQVVSLGLFIAGVAIYVMNRSKSLRVGLGSTAAE